jgi:hypothetical protein
LFLANSGLLRAFYCTFFRKTKKKARMFDFFWAKKLHCPFCLEKKALLAAQA